MIKRETKLFLTALVFYTRIPVRRKMEYSREILNNSSRYFTLVGILVGGVAAGMFMLFSFSGSIPVAVLCSMISTILLTGAFHEDGLADSFDGFGGGYSRKEKLRIMKDSRIGTYGALTLTLSLALKFFLIQEIPSVDIPWILVMAHALSRLNPILLMYTSVYVRFDEGGKAKDVGERGPAINLVIAFLPALLPLFFINWLLIPFILAALLLLLVFFRAFIHRRIQGYTGDLLGALQQLSELSIYMIIVFINHLL